MVAGTQLKLAGNAEEGMAYYHEAVAICATYAPAFYNIAVVFSEAGRAEVRRIQGLGFASSRLGKSVISSMFAIRAAMRLVGDHGPLHIRCRKRSRNTAQR
jgi:hypothetical protein